MEQAKQFHESRQTVEDLFNRLSEISNRRLLQQLYPYIYDVKEVVNQLSSYVKWLGIKYVYLLESPSRWRIRYK